MDGVTLYWIPLGAGGHVVHRCGWLFEAVAARRDHRGRLDLVHAALEVELDGERYTIEMGPAWNVASVDRGVVQAGPVGFRWLGRSVYFRYEVRCWRGGVIPDVADAVGQVAVSADTGRAESVLELVGLVPALTWGRDEVAVGEMWNSNSLAAWLLAGSGHDAGLLRPPRGARAPGWRAGLVLAQRQRATASTSASGDVSTDGPGGVGTYGPAVLIPSRAGSEHERQHRKHPRRLRRFPRF